MISSRTRYSLAQFLALFEPATSVVLFNKHGNQSLHPASGRDLHSISDLTVSTDQQTLLMMLSEVASTQSDLRAKISPRTRFDERWYDLQQCLALDGYGVEDKSLVQTDPSITAAPPIDDDLIKGLKESGAPHAAQIVHSVEASAAAFRRNPPDYNGSLTNARVALETLAQDVAADIPAQPGISYDPAKWGTVISYIRQAGQISLEEEKGLAGVYGFISAGAHRPLGIPQEHMTRLGRTLALNMCWFLLKNKQAQGGSN